MAFPADYTLLGKISTVPAQISGAHTGLPLVITEASFNNGEDIRANVFGNTINGGGDVRLSSDAAGLNQLPLQVISWDTVGDTCVIHTPRDVDGTTPADIYIWGNNPGDTQPLVTAPFGRDAVWTALHGAWHLSDNSGTDSSGNADLASAATIDTTGQIGTAQQFSSDVFDGVTAAFTGNNRSISVWLNADNATTNQYLSTFVVGGAGNYWAIIKGFQDGFANIFDGAYITGNAVDTQMALSASTWHKLDITTDGTTTKGYTDGVEQFSVPASIRDVTGTPTLRIGSSAGTTYFAGAMQYYQTILENKSAGRITTEYNNQSLPGTFFTSSSVSGGVDGNGSFPILKPVFSATGSATLPQPDGSISYTIPAPTFSVSGSATLPQPSGDVAFTIAQPVFNGVGSATLPNPTGAGAFSINPPTFSCAGSATLPNPSGSASFTIPAPIFSGTGSATLPGNVASGAFNIAKPIFNGTGSATLPQPVGVGAFTITAPSFNGIGSVTGIDIKYADDAISVVISGDKIAIVTSGDNIAKI